MKKTKQIFILSGNTEDTRKTLDELSYFKAITIIDGIAGVSEITEAFHLNKSIVCRNCIETDLVPYYAQINLICSHEPSSHDKFFDIIDTTQNIQKQFMRIAEKYEIDTGSISSVNTANSDSDDKDSCVFCRMINRKFIFRQPPLYETDNFIVIPGKGAFIDGYLMILPKQHVNSCAELSSEVQQELSQVIEDLSYLLKSIYNQKVIVWENGSGKDGYGKSKNSIVHAHVHICPYESDIIQESTYYGVKLFEIPQALTSFCKDKPYLFVINSDNKKYLRNSNELYIPRQYIRQLIAYKHNIDIELSNWRKYPFWHRVKYTANTFLDYVSKNYDQLPEHIQNAVVKFIK